MTDELRCWAEIDLAALRHNVKLVRKKIGANAGIMAIIKADGYGHGMEEIARELNRRVEIFGVANVEEGLRLRRALPSAKVFLLGPALAEERETIVHEGFIPSVSSAEEGVGFSKLTRGKRVPVHLVIDTGMGRIGVWQEEARAVLEALTALPNITVAGIASHLPVADEDDEFTARQLAGFKSLLDQLKPLAPPNPACHVLNSAGIIRFPEYAFDLVRPGLMLYGSSPIPEFQPELKPVMSVKTRVTLVRNIGPGRGISYGRTFVSRQPMKVATLPIGYADGFSRHLSHAGTCVLIGGNRCDVLGRVTMDQIVVDVSKAGRVEPGDEAAIIGSQGNEEILAVELAKKAGTISWDIFTGIKRRVKRVFRNSSQAAARS